MSGQPTNSAGRRCWRSTLRSEGYLSIRCLVFAAGEHPACIAQCWGESICVQKATVAPAKCTMHAVDSYHAAQ